MKKLTTILLAMFISIIFECSCFAEDLTIVNPSLTKEENEILNKIDEFKSIDKNISFFAELAYKNKALDLKDDRKKNIKYEYNKINKFERDLLMDLRAENNNTNNYDPNKVKLLIGVSHYKLACENLISFIESDTSREEYIYFAKYTFYKSTGLDNLTNLERFLKGGI